MKKHVDIVYKNIKNELGISKRKVMWYSTLGLIPKPRHEGVKAYYDDELELIVLLKIIGLLHRDFKYTLDEIKNIFDNIDLDSYKRLLDALEILKAEYPPIRIKYKSREGYKFRINEVYFVIISKFLSSLEKGKVIYRIKDIAKEAENMKLKDFLSYFFNNLKYERCFSGMKGIRK